ncbi:ECF transporter S component [Devriesea agamarum]|uniref:ECF transporter S component n=1 Tax=Devriesea agamarum TaxID=472569 RepID=UPI001E4F5BBD|nr:ECF transporter S component [Devriesea agamarum]
MTFTPATGSPSTSDSTDTATIPPGHPSERASGPLMKYRTVDLMVTVMIGIAFGVAFLGYSTLYSLITPLTTLFPPASGLLAGLWFLPALLAGLIVRRPGAALLAELIAAAVEMLLGGQWGLSTLASGLIQGLGVELGFAIFLYRRFRPEVAICAAIGAAVLEWIYESSGYYLEWSFGWKLLLLGFFLVSTVFLCGLLGHLIVRALAKVGALASFPAGRAHAEKNLV